METIEIWKDVKGYEGIYQVSNLGRVKSLNYGKERIIKESITFGYYRVSLSKQNKKISYFTHQLVAISFLNHTINGHTLVVNHKDGDKYNNNVNNLEIVTKRENSSTCFRKNMNTFSSKYVGVYFCKRDNNWRSQIRVNGKNKHIGYFKTEIEASEAYQKELMKI